MNYKTWLLENPDKWENTGKEIIFHVPLEEVPPEVLKFAETHKKRCENAHRRMQLIHSMGLSGMDEDWE